MNHLINFTVTNIYFSGNVMNQSIPQTFYVLVEAFNLGSWDSPLFFFPIEVPISSSSYLQIEDLK